MSAASTHGCWITTKMGTRFSCSGSREAYTARSVAGIIAHVGLLRKHHMENFEEVWDYYRQPKAVREKEEEAFLANFPDRVRREDVTIRCIGVFDTVGSLGIPHSGFCRSEYQFHDVILGPGVEYAFQALAIDEQREPFQPAVWEVKATPRVPQTVEQVWFPGVHSNIGGGYPEHVLSDATLFWMASRIAPLLELDREYLAAQAQAFEALCDGQARQLDGYILPVVHRQPYPTDLRNRSFRGRP
jgi:uncharacterized protein (DUF2235 family)